MKTTMDDHREPTSGVVCNGLGKHCLATARRPKHEHAARRVDANLFIKLKVGEWQLDGLAYFLLLYVHTSDVRIRHVRFLICQSNAAY